jgi:flagellar motor component MotA
VGSLLIPAIGLILGIVGLILNMKNKNEYSIKIGIALSIAGIMVSIFFIGFIFWTSVIMQK